MMEDGEVGELAPSHASRKRRKAPIVWATPPKHARAAPAEGTPAAAPGAETAAAEGRKPGGSRSRHPLPVADAPQPPSTQGIRLECL